MDDMKKPEDMNDMKKCSCSFKEQMIAEMKAMRENNPTEENRWVSLLFDDAKAEPLCCMLVYLFYYGYCKECTRPLSEEARAILRPLMEAGQ